MNTTLEKIIITVVGGCVGALIFKKLTEKKENTRVDEAIAKLEKETGKAKDFIDDVSSQISSTVDRVYKEDAKKIFEEKLQKFNINLIADQTCERVVSNLANRKLEALVRNECQYRIQDIVKKEVTAHAKEAIDKSVQKDIDSDFIKQMSKRYVNDKINDILEEYVKDSVNDIDFDDAISNYMEDNSYRIENLIKKAAYKVINDKLTIDIDSDEDIGLRISFD